MIRNFLTRLAQTSKRVITLFGVFMVILIGAVDFATGLELHLMFFYLFPIALVSWFVSQRAGILSAALCTLTWLVANYLSGRRYSSDLITVWNFAMRLGVSLVIAYALSQLRRMLDQVSELASRDFLTGMPNGRAFYDLAGREMQRVSVSNL